MPVRARALALASLFAASAVLGVAPVLRPTPAAAAAPKVAIIVGPVGGMTDGYRHSANRVANAAVAAGATVAKAYSPRATWARVRAAVDGANIVVYFGHGNGYPNPYTSGDEYTDRVNGFGLNRTTKNGDSDNWSTTMVYCGEKALLGTLTASDGVAQRTYCKGGVEPGPRLHDGLRSGPLRPRVRRALPEERSENDPEPGAPAREELLDPDAKARRRGLLRHGLQRCPRDRPPPAHAAGRDQSRHLQGRRRLRGIEPQRRRATPTSQAPAYWVQRTIIPGFHFGDPDYWYAFAGDPGRRIGGPSN